MKTTRRIKCQEPGCGEYAHYTYDTRADAREADLRRVKHPWKCGRHSNPDRNLGLDRLTTEIVLVNKKVMYNEEEVLGVFWNGTHGLTHGDGYRAEANDFPEGTQLIVTAHIILPDPATQPVSAPTGDKP